MKEYTIKTRDLSTGLYPYGHPRKEWIQLALAAASAASSIYGGLKSADAAKEAMRAENQNHAKEEAWFNKRYNENAADTKSGSNTIRRAKEILGESVDKVNGQAAVSGATTGAVAAAKDSANRALGNTIGNMEANHDARKDSIYAQHQQSEDNHSTRMQGYYQNRANGVAQAAQGASNALATAASAMDGGEKTAATKSVSSPAETSQPTYTVGDGSAAPAITDTVDGWRKRIGAE